MFPPSPSPSPWSWPHWKRPEVGPLPVSPSAQHLGRCTTGENLPAGESQTARLTLCVSEMSTVLSIFFSLHCYLAFEISTASTTECTRTGKKNRSSPCILLEYMAIICLGRAGSLNSHLDVYFRSSGDFNCWLSPLLPKIKSLFPQLPPKSKLTLSTAEHQHE